MPTGRGHARRTVVTAVATTDTSITTGPSITTRAAVTTGPSITTGTGTTTANARRAGGGHGIAEQPLGSGRRSVQALLQTAERFRVGVRTVSHQT